MDIYEIRKQNLISLIGDRKKGACALKWEMAAAHLSQILSSKTEKNLGDDVARRIEAIEGLDRGWMDVVHTTGQVTETSGTTERPQTSAASIVLEMLKKHAAKGMNSMTQQKIAQAVADSLAEKKLAPVQPSNVITGDFSRSTLVKGDTISIAQYDVRAAMGSGQLPADYREFVRNLVVDKVQLDDLGIKYTAPTNLKIITGWGQSMLGTIEDNSPLIVDIGVTAFVEEGVYVFTWLGHLFLKRVQLQDAEHFQLVSDNKAFEPQQARMEDVYFHARVLGAWNFKKL